MWFCIWIRHLTHAAWCTQVVIGEFDRVLRDGAGAMHAEDSLPYPLQPDLFLARWAAIEEPL